MAATPSAGQLQHNGKQRAADTKQRFACGLGCSAELQSNVLCRIARHAAPPQQVPLPIGQLFDAFFEHGQPRVRLDLGVGQLTGNPVDELLTEVDPRPRGASPKRQNFVAGDHARPGAKILPGIVGVELFPKAQLGLLNDVFGVAPMGYERGHIIAKNPLVGGEQSHEFGGGIVRSGTWHGCPRCNPELSYS